MGTLPCFYSILSKGDNFSDFPFAFQDSDTLREKRINFCSERRKFCPLSKFTPNEMEGKNKKRRVVSPEKVHIHVYVFETLPRGYKKNSCSTQLSMKFLLLINF